MTGLEFDGRDDRRGWCGIGVMLRHATEYVVVDGVASMERGWRISLMSEQSGLAKTKPPIVPGDVIIAIQDERYGKQWIPVSQVDDQIPLPSGELPEVLGPQGTPVHLRIKRAATNEIVHVTVERDAFDVIYDKDNPRKPERIVPSRSAVKGCVLTQLDELELPRYGWRDVPAHESASIHVVSVSSASAHNKERAHG